MKNTYNNFYLFVALIFTLFLFFWSIQKNSKIVQQMYTESAKLRMEIENLELEIHFLQEENSRLHLHKN